MSRAENMHGKGDDQKSLLSILQKFPRASKSVAEICLTAQSDLIVGMNMAGCRKGVYDGDICGEGNNNSSWDALRVVIIDIPETGKDYRGVFIPAGQPCVSIEFKTEGLNLELYGSNENGALVNLTATAIFTLAGTFLGFTTNSVYTNCLRAFCQSLFLLPAPKSE